MRREVKDIIKLLDEWNYEPDWMGEPDLFDINLGDENYKDWYIVRGSITVKEFGTFTHATYEDPAEFNRTSVEISIHIQEVWADDEVLNLSIEEEQKIIDKITKQVIV